MATGQNTIFVTVSVTMETNKAIYIGSGNGAWNS